MYNPRLPGEKHLGKWNGPEFSSARHEGPRTSNFDGRKFSNEIPTRNWAGHVFKWLAKRKAEPWPEWIETTHGETPPSRVDDGELRITFITLKTGEVRTLTGFELGAKVVE